MTYLSGGLTQGVRLKEIRGMTLRGCLKGETCYYGIIIRICLKVKLVCFAFNLFTENLLKACPGACKDMNLRVRMPSLRKSGGHWWVLCPKDTPYHISVMLRVGDPWQGLPHRRGSCCLPMMEIWRGSLWRSFIYYNVYWTRGNIFDHWFPNYLSRPGEI